ncbi:MAG: DNA repair protein RadC [Tannerella sp.]|jgi:DNA repair protein RadC|nr:DNA repair protein RadC [Tannerella sp.]
MDDDGARLRIKQLAAEDRPREKLLLKGPAALSEAELIALLISSGNDEETAVQLAQRILSSVANDLFTLGKLTVKDLMKFKGIGPAKAVTIAAALDLGRRRKDAVAPNQVTIQSSKDAFQLFYPLLCDLPHEEIWMALTNSRCKVLEKTQIGRGGLTATSADLRIVMRMAVNSPSCTGIVLCHNHPSGSASPSEQDDHLTFKLKQAAAFFDIKLQDHIIISNTTYYSYADEGRL